MNSLDSKTKRASRTTSLCGALVLIISLLSSSYCVAQTKEADPELKAFLSDTINTAHSFDDEYDAQVWLIAMSTPLNRFIKDPKRKISLLSAIHREATAAKLDPDLVLALIQTESAFNQFAVSRVGAQGLMQVMPFWKKEIGRPDDNLTDVDTNLKYGCRILQFYLKKEKGNLTRALARYNGSLGKTWYPERVMDYWRRYWYAGKL